MKRLVLCGFMLALLVGCARQPEYGPKVTPSVAQRYNVTWEEHGLSEALCTIQDTTTGEEWLVWFRYKIGAVLLRHTGGTP